MSVRYLTSRVLCDEPEIDFVSPGGDVVVHYYSVTEAIT
jgi:hypothetical protein